MMTTFDDQNTKIGLVSGQKMGIKDQPPKRKPIPLDSHKGRVRKGSKSIRKLSNQSRSSRLSEKSRNINLKDGFQTARTVLQQDKKFDK